MKSKVASEEEWTRSVSCVNDSVQLIIPIYVDFKMTRFIAAYHDSIYDTDFDFVAGKSSLKKWLPFGVFKYMSKYETEFRMIMFRKNTTVLAVN